LCRITIDFAVDSTNIAQIVSIVFLILMDKKWNRCWGANVETNITAAKHGSEGKK
jgi:hypothetical protein